MRWLGSDSEPCTGWDIRSLWMLEPRIEAKGWDGLTGIEECDSWIGCDDDYGDGIDCWLGELSLRTYKSGLTNTLFIFILMTILWEKNVLLPQLGMRKLDRVFSIGQREEVRFKLQTAKLTGCCPLISVFWVQTLCSQPACSQRPLLHFSGS